MPELNFADLALRVDSHRSSEWTAAPGNPNRTRFVTCPELGLRLARPRASPLGARAAPATPSGDPPPAAPWKRE